MANRVEHHSEGEVVYLALDPDGVWARSEFPHPLITIDYDADDNVIGINPVGPRVAQVLREYTDWLTAEGRDPRVLLAAITSKAADCG